MAFESINLNIIPTGDKPVFHAAQYDVNRPIIINLFWGEDAYNVPEGVSLELQVRKVDNNIVTAEPDSVVTNVVTFLTTEQMTACSGTNLCEVQLTDGDDNSIATLQFYLVVQRDTLAGGLTSQSEIYNLEGQIAALVPEVIGDEYYTAEEVDEKIAEIPTFDPSNYYDKTQLYTKSETNGLLSQKANTSSLSAVATSGDYDDLINKPTIPDVSNYYTKSETYNQTEVNNLLATKADTSSLSAVATSGDYDDLLNKPSIPAAQVNSDWDALSGVAQILNKPSLSTVATSGDYGDLLNKPTIPAAQVNSDWNANSGVAQILNKPSLATVATSGAYSDLSGKPTIPTVDLAESSSVVGVNGTWQIPATILNHALVIVSIRRQGLGNSAIFSVDDLKARDNGFMLASSPNSYGILKCDSNGLLTVTALNSMSDVFIRAIGLF